MIKSGMKIAGLFLMLAVFAGTSGQTVYAQSEMSTEMEVESSAEDNSDEDNSDEDGSDEGSSGKTTDAAASEANNHLADGHAIPEGVSVNGMDLGGMSISEIADYLDTYVDGVLDSKLVLNIDGDKLKIKYSDIDMKAVESDVVDEISHIGRDGNLIKRYKELADVKNNKADYTITFEYDKDKLAQKIEKKTEEYNRDPENPSLVRHSGEFIVTEAKTGIKVDLDATVAAVEKVLDDNWTGDEVKVDVVCETTQPEHSTEELACITDLLGSYSTDFSSSTSNRIANIDNGARLIDETVIYPGETFSFLDNVVPFTADNGYYEATGYAGGKVVPSIGGGICQVSSTLYNAVLRAELEVVERSNHGLTVGYVPLGADATVSEGSCDFRFKNNLDSAIYLESYTYGSQIYTCIYGKETRPSSRTIEFYSVTEQTIAPGDDVITEDDTQPEGYEEVTQTAHAGYVASFYKYVYENGELTDKIKLNTSSYRAAPRYVTVGTKKVDETKKETETEAETKKSE